MACIHIDEMLAASEIVEFDGSLVIWVGPHQYVRVNYCPTCGRWVHDPVDHDDPELEVAGARGG
jgi:hypothetical protein